MKITFSKKIEINNDTFLEETWYYVHADDLCKKATKDKDAATKYWEALNAFYATHGTIVPITDIIEEKEI